MPDGDVAEVKGLESWHNIIDPYCMAYDPGALFPVGHDTLDTFINVTISPGRTLSCAGGVKVDMADAGAQDNTHFFNYQMCKDDMETVFSACGSMGGYLTTGTGNVSVHFKRMSSAANSVRRTSDVP
jgi:hypothetical protein